jgi:hypothetical protein
MLVGIPTYAFNRTCIQRQTPISPAARETHDFVVEPD